MELSALSLFAGRSILSLKFYLRSFALGFLYAKSISSHYTQYVSQILSFSSSITHFIGTFSVVSSISDDLFGKSSQKLIMLGTKSACLILMLTMS